MTKLHCIQLGDSETDESTIYRDSPGYPSIAEALQRIRDCDQIVFHNGIGFDYDAISHWHPGVLQLDRMLDTLVLARLSDPQERDHSLAAWGKRTGTIKGEYKGDYSTWDEEFEAYSLQDIPAGRALFHKVKHVLSWGHCVEVEHKFARAMVLQERNGFTFNVKKAEALDLSLSAELDAMSDELAKTFPPLERTATFTPKVTLPKRGYIKGVPFTKRWQEEFNCQSRAHVAERLVMLGWRPRDYGENGIPTVDEKVLASLPYPEAKVLVRYFSISKRQGMLSGGKSAWLKSVRKDGRIHGRVNPNGAVTGRCTHSSPNIAQADKKDLRMRELFEAKAGWKLVGCDAEGLEARFLGHFLAKYDGGHYVKVILEGDKKARTDVHSLNVTAVLRAAIIRGEKAEIDAKWGKLRDGLKTCLYAMIFGARDAKLGTTMKQVIRDCGVTGPVLPPVEMGALTRKAIEKAMPGLGALTLKVQAAAKAKRFLMGVDGRHMPVKSVHAALNVICQGGGAAVMKKAMCLFLDHCDSQDWQNGRDYGVCASVHDEVQIECRPEIAEDIGKAFADAIRDAGAFYNLRCPMAGAYDIGTNWASTH